MPRPLRLEYPGAFWHAYNRGVERREVYLSDSDRSDFLELLARAQSQFRWRIHAFVLMTNHYHLLIETPEPTLARGMQRLDGDHAAAFNRKHARVGHLWQGRYRAHLIEKESYLLELSRYIVLNPVRAHMVATPGEWPWSSYVATAGMCARPAWLDVDTILDSFDPWDRTKAHGLYRQFIADGVGLSRSPWEDLKAKLYLGGEAFVAQIEELTTSRMKQAVAPAMQRNIRAVDATAVLGAVEAELEMRIDPKRWSNAIGRLAFASLARSEAIATFHQIGERLGLSSEGARHLARRAHEREAHDEVFRVLLNRLRLQISHMERRV